MQASVKLGLSVAASWAWGSSMIVGMTVAQQKGLQAWLIWAVANTLCLIVLGELSRRGLFSRRIFDIGPLKYAALVVQGICLVINLSIINSILISLGLGQMASYLTATAVGAIFVLLMFKHGLTMSIFTDRYQWFFTHTAIAAILGLGLWHGEYVPIQFESSGSDLMWGAWSACVLLSAPLTDIMLWQRAEVAGKTRAFYWGALFFGVYLCFVLAMAHFQFSYEMKILLLLAVLGVTTSTIDSIAVAMHEMVNRQVGTVVSLIICAAWGLVASWGIIELWSRMGIYRVGLGLVMICVATWLYRKHGAAETKSIEYMQQVVR